MDLSQTSVLIVDDCGDTRKLLRMCLKQCGVATIHEADSVKQALELLQRQPIQLILSDWQMPSESGLDFLQKVRQSKRHARTPFIMITSDAQKDSVMEAMKLGVNDYIAKPFTAQTIEDKLVGLPNVR
jgi:two-component system, chemotaxis family, chemotaxis protein CheY